LVRVRLTTRLCALPPGTSVIELGFTLLMAMLGAFTVSLKVAVAKDTPLPLAGEASLQRARVAATLLLSSDLRLGGNSVLGSFSPN
jgi:hypothetical protein